MDSKKKLRAVRRGMANLHNQLEPLRAKITKLEFVHADMCKTKWALEEKILRESKKTFKVFYKPKKKVPQEMNISELFSMLTPEQREELVAKLRLRQ